MKACLTIACMALAPWVVLAEPAWPADYAARESAQRAAAKAAASSQNAALADYDTRSWSLCTLEGLGTALDPFEPRTFTWETAACTYLKTDPVKGLCINFR